MLAERKSQRRWPRCRRRLGQQRQWRYGPEQTNGASGGWGAEGRSKEGEAGEECWDRENTTLDGAPGAMKRPERGWVWSVFSATPQLA